MAIYESGRQEQENKQQQFGAQQGQNRQGYRQQQEQEYGRQQGQDNQFPSQQRSNGNEETVVNFAELALRGTAALVDIQLSTIRSLWQLQARSAAVFGAPDYSDFLRFADTGAKRLLSAGTEQILNSARQASDTITEVQRQFGRLVEQGSVQFTEEIRQGIQELSQRTQEGLQDVKNLAQQGRNQAYPQQQKQDSQRAQNLQSGAQQSKADQPPHIEQPRPGDEQERSNKQRRSA